MTRLHVFDMDGTLLRGTTAGLEIARRLDCLPELVALEGAFAAGTLDTRGFAAAVSTLWRALTPALVAETFAGSPWIGGMPEVFADIRRRGERSVVVTMSPDFFADLLVGAGADEVIASRFPPLPLAGPPDPAGILVPEDKVGAVDRLRAALALGRDSCVAYGDSGSDLPLFRTLRHTVAVNAGSALRDLARYRYDGDDLRAAYQLARAGMRERDAPTARPGNVPLRPADTTSR
ncbi:MULTISPECIES: HAD family hydrolase [unclassified Streptomyces]|uniref:HAD family hydrolase n=1 Tax=unclassified Streptomyces TaxID=2593676 RepID=UPI002E27C400|nr:HAD-IB family phosphatase [Streptomyces sp. NBC_00223]